LHIVDKLLFNECTLFLEDTMSIGTRTHTHTHTDGAVVVVNRMQSVPITTVVVSSNLHQGEVSNIMW